MLLKQKFILIFLSTFVTNVFSNVIVTQPDKILGFTGYDGRQIQLEFQFTKPIDKNQIVDFFIDNKKILSMKNETNQQIERFATRLRFNKDETLTIKTTDSSTNFVPTVATNYVAPTNNSYQPQPRTSVISEQIAKSYNAKVGDCIYMIGGISNSGNQVPTKFIIKVNNENVIVDSSDRVAMNPWFVIGIKETAKSCDISVQ
jgi:hypothetical protein